MRTSGPGHDYTVSALAEELRRRLPAQRFLVREEKPLALGNYWTPLPDVSVVRGARKAFAGRTPGRADVALVVEVADTTYAKDAGPKRRLYERCGVPRFWLVDLPRRRVEVHERTAQGLAVVAVDDEHQSVPLALDVDAYDPIPLADVLP